MEMTAKRHFCSHSPAGGARSRRSRRLWETSKTRSPPHWLWGMPVDFTSTHIFFLRWPAGIKVLIPDSVSVLCYPWRASQPHPSASPPISPGLLQAIVADWWWPLRPIGEVSAGLGLQWPPAACERQQRAAGLSCRIRVPCLPTVSDKEEGCREEERTAGCCPPMGADNRGSRKNTSFYPCSVKSSVQFFIRSLLLCCLRRLTATSHVALILLVFAPHSFLNPKSLLPSQLALFDCSGRACVLPTSSPFCCVSITSEHATSQHKPSSTPRMTAAHLILSSLSLQALLFFFVAPPLLFFFLFFLRRLLGPPCSSLFKNIYFCILEIHLSPLQQF